VSGFAGLPASFPGKVLDQPPEIEEVNVKTRGIDCTVAGVIGGIDTC